MSARRGLLFGCIGSLGLVVVVFAIVLSSEAWSYQGHCISFEPPARECSIVQYLFLLVILSIVFPLPFVYRLLSWSIWLIVLLLPILGYEIGKRSESKAGSSSLDK